MDLHTEKSLVMWISEYRCTGLREYRINRKLKTNLEYHKHSNTQLKISLFL